MIDALFTTFQKVDKYFLGEIDLPHAAIEKFFNVDRSFILFGHSRIALDFGLNETEFGALSSDRFVEVTVALPIDK